MECKIYFAMECKIYFAMECKIYFAKANVDNDPYQKMYLTQTKNAIKQETRGIASLQ